MVYGKISSSDVGVREGVKVMVGMGAGVDVSAGPTVGSASGTENGAEDWQAASNKKSNRPMLCFMNGLYQRSSETCVDGYTHGLQSHDLLRQGQYFLIV